MNSPSIAPQPASHSSIESQLDELLRGQPGPEKFVRGVLVLCNHSPDAVWELLALIDQYYRRRRISETHFRAARAAIQQRALGIQDKAAVTGEVARIVSPAAPAPTNAAAASPAAAHAAAVPAAVAAVAAMPAARTPASPPASPPEAEVAAAPAQPVRKPAVVPVIMAPVRPPASPVPQRARDTRGTRSGGSMLRLAFVIVAAVIAGMLIRSYWRWPVMAEARPEVVDARPEVATKVPEEVAPSKPARSAPPARAAIAVTTVPPAATAEGTVPAAEPAAPVIAAEPPPVAKKVPRTHRIISCVELIQKREDGEKLTPRESQLLENECLE